MKNRREFLTEVAAAGSAVALLPSTGCARKRKKGAVGPGAALSKGRARVVLVTSAGAMDKAHKVDRAVIRRMLEAGLVKLTGARDARAALGRWIKPSDTVGLKVNCLGGRMMSTRVELTEELVGLLASTGLARDHVTVFDRSDMDLRHGGYPVRSSGSDYRCRGNDSAGYERDLEVMPSGASRFCTMVTRRASMLINLPVLKDHGICGLTASLKNNFGLVHNPNKFHLNGCDPHVAEVNARPFVRDKQKLVVCDALRVQVEGGPAYHAAHAVTYGGILLATDPVALDMMAWGILEQLRKERKLPSLPGDRREPKYLQTAAKQGLGVGQIANIELLRVKI